MRAHVDQMRRVNLETGGGGGAARADVIVPKLFEYIWHTTMKVAHTDSRHDAIRVAAQQIRRVVREPGQIFEERGVRTTRESQSHRALALMILAAMRAFPLGTRP